MTPSDYLQPDNEFRINHALRTYHRLRDDLRQAVLSGRLEAPEDSLGCPEHCAFNIWIDGLFSVNGQQMAAVREAVKAAHVRVHHDAVLIAEMIRTQRPDEAHAALHAPGFAQAMGTLIDGLQQMQAHLRAAA